MTNNACAHDLQLGFEVVKNDFFSLGPTYCKNIYGVINLDSNLMTSFCSLFFV